jgi:regulator of protease activity HflC (stomatin/prohibitin superfamily)
MLDWLKVIFKFLPRFLVLNQDEGGLFLRKGKYKKTVGAGVYFLLPVVDEIVVFNAATATLDTTTQSVTTADKRDLLVSWSATYLIHDPKVAFLETDDIQAQITSSLSARLLGYINRKEYPSLGSQGIVAYMTSEGFRMEFMEEWGINIQGFYLKDLALHRIFRLVKQEELK